MTIARHVEAIISECFRALRIFHGSWCGACCQLCTCWFSVLFFSVLYIMYPMLPVTLDCLFLIGTLIFSNVNLMQDCDIYTYQVFFLGKKNT